MVQVYFTYCICYIRTIELYIDYTIRRYQSIDMLVVKLWVTIISLYFLRVSYGPLNPPHMVYAHFYTPPPSVPQYENKIFK